jgi:hypothetical protein
MARWVRCFLPLCLGVLAACRLAPYEPSKATRAYPSELKQESVAQVQVIPGPTSIQLVNATAASYANFDLWLNQRYVTHIDSLASGQTLEVPLNSMWDERGETPFTGGWFRYYQPTPIVLAQIQVAPDKPLIGLLAKPPDVNRR